MGSGNGYRRRENGAGEEGRGRGYHRGDNMIEEDRQLKVVVEGDR